MKQSDDVFFFTLIDFLLQVFFFGLVLYVLSQAAQSDAEQSRKKDEEQIQKLLKATGVSNLTELTDELSNLAPIKELKGVADFISKSGGPDKAAKVSDFVRDAGGPENIKASLARLRKLEEGMGKPPCIFSIVGDKKVVKPLATVIADDSTIAFQGTSTDLDEVLRLLGMTYSSVKVLSLSEFRKAFSPIVQKKPECRYTLRFLEKTRLVDARDAARFSFYLNIGKP